jgi:hypothetical protein
MCGHLAAKFYHSGTRAVESESERVLGGVGSW